MQGQRLTERSSTILFGIVVVARFFDGTRMKGVDEAIQREIRNSEIITRRVKGYFPSRSDQRQV